MSGLQTVKLTLGGSPITLSSIDTDLLKECQRVLERHFDRKSPAFSDFNEDESPGRLGSFQLAAALAVDTESSLNPVSPHTEFLSPCIKYYPVEIETNAAVFTDEIDKFGFSPSKHESRPVFAPIIADVRSLNPKHHGDSWSNCGAHNGAVWPDSVNDPLDTSVKLEAGDWDVRADDDDSTCSGCGLLVAHADSAKHERTCGSDTTQSRQYGKHINDLQAPILILKDAQYNKRRLKNLKRWWRKDCKPVTKRRTKKKATKKRLRFDKAQPVSQLGVTLRSHNAPPMLLPFYTEGSRDPALDPPSKTRPRDPLGVPDIPAPAPLSTRRKPFVSVLSNERFASVTSPARATKATMPSQSRKRSALESSNGVPKSLKGVLNSSSNVPESSKDVPNSSKGIPNSSKARIENCIVKAVPVKRVRIKRKDTVEATIARVVANGRQKVSADRFSALFRCGKCNARFADKVDFREHKREHLLQCKHCKCRFTNQFNVDLHQQVFHPETVIPKDITPPTTSDSGNEKNKRKVSPAQQLRVRQVNGGTPLIDDPSLDLRNLLPLTDDSGSDHERPRSPAYHPYRKAPKRRLFGCHICPMRCSNAYLLRKHVSAHSVPNRIECHVCHKIFNNERICAAHVEKTHGVEIVSEDVGPLPCKGCNAVLVSPMRLAEHYCTAHINLALLGCGICRTVLSLMQWRTHASVHI